MGYDVPIDSDPPPPTLADRLASLPFAKLEPGDSFFIPYNLMPYREIRKLLTVAKQKWRDREFISRRREEGGVEGMRIWRRIDKLPKG